MSGPVTKTSIRYFNRHPVRARWDEGDNEWWYAAVDVIEALVRPQNARKYWHTFKTRHPELSAFCRQLKFTAADRKSYNMDCLRQQGINTLLLSLPAKKRQEFSAWLNGMLDPLDEQSKRNAYELYDNHILQDIAEGTLQGLQQIHAFLFGGLYEFAGKIRTKNISKGGFIFANCMYFTEIFAQLEGMPDNTFEEIVDKYIEMNIVHPFMEGNGRATRIWLDVLLKRRINRCIDWQRIDKDDYLHAMEVSPHNSAVIKKLLFLALTDRIEDREIFLKGIDYSYYYETISEEG